MELKSSIEERMLRMPMLVVLLTLKDRDSLVKLLKSVPKRTKMDRLDEYMINNLIQALENPKQVEEDSPPQPEVKLPLEKEAPRVEVKKADNKPINKEQIVKDLKSRLDPKNEKDFDTFVKESIDYGVKQMGIKTFPKSNNAESFYDWLVGNSVIDAHGNPLAR